MKTVKNKHFFVYYKMKNELGLVKRPNNSNDGYFTWYHLGGTAANTPNREIDIIEDVDFILEYDFSNSYAKKSLIERYLQLKEGKETDLVDVYRDNLELEFRESY